MDTKESGAELRVIKGELKGKDLRDLFLYQWRTGDLLDVFDKFGFDLSNVGKDAIPCDVREGGGRRPQGRCVF